MTELPELTGYEIADIPADITGKTGMDPHRI